MRYQHQESPRRSLLCLALISMFSSAASAATESAAVSMSPVEVTGYFDFYDQMSTQGHAGGTGGRTNVVEGRAFDRVTNALTLNMVELSAKKKTGKLAFRLDVAFGEMIDSLASNGGASPMGGSAVNAGANEPTRNISQATITYTPFDGLSLTAGKFYSHMGLEVVKAKDNMQYSRSLMFNYGIPFWNQGLNATYSIIPNRLTAALYILNASDGRISAEANKSPVLGANLNFVPFEGFSANYNYIGGIESSASNSRRDVHEVNAVYTVSSSVTVAADSTIGTEQNTVSVTGGASQGVATWSGAAIYLKAALTDWYTLSPRFEIFDDEKGWALGGLASKASLADVVPGQKINSITVSNIFNLGDGFETRLEYRADRSDRSGYYKDEAGAVTDRQDTYTAALLYSF